jgi:phosphoglycerol transferase MdoB-like AlkP superfamily enzyme
MENPTTIETLLEKAEQYTRTSIELAKLQAIDKGADIVSSAVAGVAITVVVGTFLMLLNIGIAFWIGEMLGAIYYGFFAVGAFYLLVALMLYLFRNQWIKLPISDRIITGMLTPRRR